MAIAFFLVSIVAIAAELFACKKKICLLKNIAKPILVPAMTLTCLSMLESNGSSFNSIYPLIVAMTLYALGDVFLIPKKKMGIFLSGMISFALGHIVIACMAVGFGISLISLLVSSVIWFMLLFFFFFPRLDSSNQMTPYLKAYSVIIVLFGIVVSSSSFNGNIPARIIAIMGVGMFAISDMMIGLRITDGKERGTRVMATYIVAVALILSSFYLMNSV